MLVCPIKPMGKRLVVEPMDDEALSSIIEVVQFDKFNTKSSGIEGKSKTRGRVLAMGRDCDHQYGVKVGDVIRFTKNGGLPVSQDGKDYLILNEKDLIGPEEDGDNP
jgi:co-chaperonin GroES (HSP10)